MAISPIETVTMAPKSQQASFQKGTEVQKPVHEQISLTQKMHQEVKHNSEKTLRMEATKNPEYRYNVKEKKQDQNNNRKKKNNEKSKSKDHKAEKQENSGFDIRI